MTHQYLVRVCDLEQHVTSISSGFYQIVYELLSMCSQLLKPTFTDLDIEQFHEPIYEYSIKLFQIINSTIIVDDHHHFVGENELIIFRFDFIHELCHIIKAFHDSLILLVHFVDLFIHFSGLFILTIFHVLHLLLKLGIYLLHQPIDIFKFLIII